MKKIILFPALLFFLLLLSNCTSVYRVYNDEDLSDMAIGEYGFSRVLFFKVVDQDTVIAMTGESYLNSGIIYGVRNNTYQMLFVPKKAAEEPFYIESPLCIDVDKLITELKTLKDSFGNYMYLDPSDDYGGLSISVYPYDSIHEANPNLMFDTNVFYIFTSDRGELYVGIIDSETHIFDGDFNEIE